MQRFTDVTGREWPVEINFSALRRVKDLAKLDLLDPEQLKTLGGDLLVMPNVLFAVVKPTADQLSIGDEAFADLLVPVFDDAIGSFFQELEDFFRRLGRTALATLIQEILTWRKTQEEAATSLVTDPEVRQEIAATLTREMRATKTTLLQQLRQIGGETSTDSPESSESTQPG